MKRNGRSTLNSIDFLSEVIRHLFVGPTVVAATADSLIEYRVNKRGVAAQICVSVAILSSTAGTVPATALRAAGVLSWLL